MKYKIVIGEILSSHMKGYFDSYNLINQGNRTIITGDIVDQAALFGVIATIRDLHLTLISIQPL